jgi:lipopolysaccharide export system permease protein
MTKILDRYLIREFIVPLVYCLAAFLLVYVIYDLSAHLDNYIEEQIPLSMLVNYYRIQLPLVLVNVIPLSILLAVIYCLGSLSRHNEITAMRANGISMYRITLPFLVLGVLFTALLFYLNDNFAPEAYARSEKLIEEHSRKKDEHKLQPIAFYNPLGERAWAGRWKAGSQTISEVSIRNLQNRQVIEKISAARASFLDGEWWLFDGTIQRYDSRGRLRGTEEEFSKRRFAFNEKPDDFLSSQKDSVSMSYSELSRNMAFYPPDSDIYGRKLVDLRYKIAFPFVGITIVLISIPLAVGTSRGGAAGSVGMSIALFMSYYTFLMLSLALGRRGTLPPWAAAWLPNIVFSGIGAVLLYRSQHMTEKKIFTRADWVPPVTALAAAAIISRWVGGVGAISFIAIAAGSYWIVRRLTGRKRVV